jgi:hypothetical protein
LPIDKYTVAEGRRPINKDNINSFFLKFDGNQKQKAYIIRSKKKPPFNIGLSGGRYFYLMDTAMFENKLLFFLRNPCGQSHFRGMYDKITPELNSLIKEKMWLIDIPGNFIINDDEFMEQICEMMVIHYHHGFKISTFTDFKCEYEKEVFLEFATQEKGRLNLCAVQSSQHPGNQNCFDPLMYHVVRLSDSKLVGGNENNEGCFGAQYTSILDKFNDVEPPAEYLIRLKKKLKEGPVANELFMKAYSKNQIQFYQQS